MKIFSNFLIYDRFSLLNEETRYKIDNDQINIFSKKEFNDFVNLQK